jgi:hypothetical protein
VLQIQILRWRFDEKTPTRRVHASREAKIFAICDARLLAKISNKTGWQKSLPDLCPHKHPRRGNPASAAKGVPRGNVLAPFLDTSWGVPRSVNKKAIRSARDKVAQYERM